MHSELLLLSFSVIVLVSSCCTRLNPRVWVLLLPCTTSTGSLLAGVGLFVFSGLNKDCALVLIFAKFYLDLPGWNLGVVRVHFVL